MKARIPLLLALAACTPTRPDGAYVAEYKDPSACEPGIPCEDGGDTPTPDEDAGGGDEPTEDSGPVDEPDAEPDVMIDPSNPLAALEGSYLMRIDYYSSATATDSGTTLSIKNRVSNLFFTTLSVVDGKLRAVEQLCAQTSKHQCLNSNCSNWVTTYDADLPAKFRDAGSKVEREWQVEGNTLTVAAGDALLPLGFTPSSDPSVFPDTADSTVWQFGSEPERRGVHTFVTANLLTALRLRCHIGSVMVFASAFNGELKTVDANGLAGLAPLPVDSTGTKAKPVYASGDPSNVCVKEKLEGGTSADDRAFVRFKKAGLLTGCPATGAAFEAAFPLPSSADLNPP